MVSHGFLYFHGLREFQFSRIKLVIGAFFADQILVGSPFDNSAVIQHDNGVAVADGRQTVGNDKYRPSLHQVIHPFLDNAFGSCVDAGRCV